MELMRGRISTNFRLAHQNRHFLVLWLYVQTILILKWSEMVLVRCIYWWPFNLECFLCGPCLLIAHADFFSQVHRIRPQEIIESDVEFLIELSFGLLNPLRPLICRWQIGGFESVGRHATLMLKSFFVLNLSRIDVVYVSSLILGPLDVSPY